MLMMPASSSQAVGSQTTLPAGNPPTSRITPPWGKGDPPISVTGMLPSPLGKTWAGGNMWQHLCSLESPEFKDASSHGKEGERTHSWRAHNNITCSEAWEGTSLCFSTCSICDTIRYRKRINQHVADLVNEWGSMLDIDFWPWYWKVTPKGMVRAFRIRFWEMFSAPITYNILTDK